MSKTNVASQIEVLIRPVIEEINLELVDVEFVKEGAQWYLRVYIDKPEGVGLDDCQAVSEKIDIILDEKDPISQSYILEVSSPGIERPLKKADDYLRFAGRLISVNTYAPLNGSKNITGQLIGLEDSKVVIVVDGEQISIPIDKIASAKLVVEF